MSRQTFAVIDIVQCRGFPYHATFQVWNKNPQLYSDASVVDLTDCTVGGSIALEAEGEVLVDFEAEIVDEAAGTLHFWLPTDLPVGTYTYDQWYQYPDGRRVCFALGKYTMIPKNGGPVT